jgi:hypothetical protein
MHASQGTAPSRLPVHACTAPVRFVTAALRVLAALNVVYIAAVFVHAMLVGEPPASALLVAQGLVLFSGVPWALAALLDRFCAATLEIEPARLLLTVRGARFEIPLASVAGLRPFWLPLPGAGLFLVMTSERRFRYRLLPDPPGPVLAALSSVLPAARGLEEHPTMAYAGARYEIARRRWYFWLGKFGLLPLCIAAVIFRLNQYILYGGAFGEYHLYGLARYLRSFAFSWIEVLSGLVVYAGTLRVVAEIFLWLSAFALPRRARTVRRIIEALCQLAYFGLVPALLLWRLLI